MEINKVLIDGLINDIDIAIKKMKEEKENEKKIFYFSSIHASLERTYNIQYSSKLLFMNFILMSSYQIINNRMSLNIREKKETKKVVFPIDKEFFNVLIKLCEELKSIMEKPDLEEIYLLSEKFVCHTYKLSGNGHYLMSKGIELMP